MRSRPQRNILKRGDVQLSWNNPARAIVNYTKAIELDPSFAQAYVRRGLAQRANGSLNGAIKDFEKAESIDPETTINNRHIAEAYSNRGFIELNDLQIDEAIADFTKAIQHYCDPIHYHRRGQAHLLEENLEGALEDFCDALSLNPEDEFLTSMIYVNRGYALRLQGYEREAEVDFQTSLRIHHGQKIKIELHIHSLDSQIKQMRKRRLETQRNVS